MSVTQAVIRELLQVYVVQKLVAGITESIDNFMAGTSTQKAVDLTRSIPDLHPILNTTTVGTPIDAKDIYEGGGFTGSGARAGGVDGKGGFPAILHPNETVIDHTKGQGMGATVNFNISTVDAAGFDQLLASRKGLITSIINNAMNNQGKMGVV
jgi:hypothetical protein